MRYLCLAPLLFLAAPTLAADSATVIADMDAAMNRATDQKITWNVLNKEPKKASPSTMRFISLVKGEKSFVQFEQPKDLKDTRVLVLARDQMYVYLPSYRRVRRIASHVTQQGFMGTTYSHDDMSASRFGDVYDGVISAEDDTSWTLEFSPKAGAKTAYAKAIVTVAKSNNMPTELKYFNAKGVHVKTETRSSYECRGDVCLPGVMRMEDHTRAGAWTELQQDGWELNQGIADDFFSPKNLPNRL